MKRRRFPPRGAVGGAGATSRLRVLRKAVRVTNWCCGPQLGLDFVTTAGLQASGRSGASTERSPECEGRHPTEADARFAFSFGNGCPVGRHSRSRAVGHACKKP